MNSMFASSTSTVSHNNFSSTNKNKNNKNNERFKIIVQCLDYKFTA